MSNNGSRSGDRDPTSPVFDAIFTSFVYIPSMNLGVQPYTQDIHFYSFLIEYAVANNFFV